MSFYCKKVCGDPNFSIKEWNRTYKYCNDVGLSEEESNKILNQEFYPCKTQCEDCLNTVLDTQLQRKFKPQ
jgi:hypothetical protein